MTDAAREKTEREFAFWAGSQKGMLFSSPTPTAKSSPFYFQLWLAATERTARECAEICHRHVGAEDAANDIEEKFGL